MSDTLSVVRSFVMNSLQSVPTFSGAITDAPVLRDTIKGHHKCTETKKHHDAKFVINAGTGVVITSDDIVLASWWLSVFSGCGHSTTDYHIR